MAGESETQAPDLKRPTGPWLAIDVGKRRIGLAMSDPTGQIATPLLVLAVRGKVHDLAEITGIVEKRGVAGVVVGLPIRDDGVWSEQTALAERFATRLANKVRIPVFLHDERYSSWEAAERRRARTEMTGHRRDRQTPFDAEAAAIILESFLASLLPGSSRLVTAPFVPEPSEPRLGR